MRRLAKAFLIISSLGYTSFLFYVYAYFADQPRIYVRFLNNELSFTSNTLFYTGIIVPIIVVLVCVLLASVIDKQPVGVRLYLKHAKVKDQLFSWSMSMAGIFNLFAAAVVSIVLFSNNEEGLTRTGYAPFLFIGVILLSVWIILLPVILFKNKQESH
jgi:hypothetical protein